MFLLHMSIEGGIAKIRFVAVLALEVAAIHVVLRPPLVLASAAIARPTLVPAVVIIVLIGIRIIVIWLLHCGDWSRLHSGKVDDWRTLTYHPCGYTARNVGRCPVEIGTTCLRDEALLGCVECLVLGEFLCRERGLLWLPWELVVIHL
jgi:hypothetical protein